MDYRRNRAAPEGRGRGSRVHWEDNVGFSPSPPRLGGFPPGELGSPPYGYIDDSPRRFAGESPPQRYLEAAPPGYHESPPRRFPIRPPPPPQYLSPEDSPPYRYIEDATRRFGGPGRPYSEDVPLPADIDGPPPPGYIDEAPRRFGGTSPLGNIGYRHENARRFLGSESPSPPRQYGPPPPPPGGYTPPHGGYTDEAARRFGGTPPRQFPVGSPPEYAEGPPRRFRSTPPRQVPDGSPLRAADEAPQRFAGGTPPRQLVDETTPGYVDEAPRRFTGGTPPRTPPRQFVGGSPPQHPDGAPRRFVGGTPPRQAVDGSPPGLIDEAQRKPGGGTPPRQFVDGAPRHAGQSPDRFAAVTGTAPPRQFVDRARRFPDESPDRFAGADGSQFPIDSPPGYGDDPRRLTITPPRRPDGPPPLSFPRFPPDIFTDGITPRFPPEVFAAGAAPVRTAPTPRPDVRPAQYPDSSPDFAPGDASPPPPYRSRYEAVPARPPMVREPYRPPPPGLGGDAPLLGVHPGYVAPRPPAARGSSPPDFLFANFPRRHPDGYTARTPPRQPNDAIFTADVVPIELDDKLKEVQPHSGNPGSSTGGGWRDLWAALIFLLHIGGIGVLCVLFGLQGLTSTIENYSKPNSFHITDWFPQLAAAAVVGAVFSIAWQNAIRIAPVLMILVTIWTGAATMTLFGIVLVGTGKTTGLVGLIFFFVGLCQALYAFVIRERIPFAGELLKKVISVCSSYPSTYVVSYSIVLVALGWIALWIFGLSGSGVRPKHAAIMVALAGSLIWTMQVLRNIVRVTVAGTVALIYFQERNMPSMPTYVSLVRACTSSLGSICFGSFFVPVVETPCHVLRRINAQAGTSEFLFSCILCLLGCFDHLIRYFNKMGYIQVAMYGKPFVRASKDTWDMLRAQAVDVLVHDDLTATILFLACCIGGSLSALVAGIWCFIVVKSLSVVISLLSFLIGFLITYLTMAVVESGVATYYVCFAEDPASLQRHDGPLYERMWVRQMELQTPVTELTV